MCVIIGVMISGTTLFGQHTFEQIWDDSKDQWLVNSFRNSYPDFQVLNACPPDLSASIPESSVLDESLHPYRTDRDLEAACIDYYFSNGCEGFANIQLLSDLYFPLFERHLQANKLEEDYKFLAIIQSALNAHFSDGVNKAGLWGLDLPRARKEGLQVDRFIDERKAPDLSTQAAVRLLKQYDQRYQSDPLKVAVAFLRGVPYADRFIPGETTDPELEFQLTFLHVSIRMFKHTDSQNALMSWLRMLNEFEAIPVDQDASFSAITAVLGPSKEDIAGLNPTFSGNKAVANYRNVPFLLPKGYLEKWHLYADSVYCYKPPKPVLEEAQAANSNRKPEGDVVVYKVRSGDVLGLIASRYGVRVRDLKDWNNLRSDRIDIGQELLIYGSSTPPTPKPKEVVAPSSSTPPQGDYEIYTVQNGESLWIIARKFPGVSADNIMKWNGISESIQPGQKLKIYNGQ